MRIQRRIEIVEGVLCEIVEWSRTISAYSEVWTRCGHYRQVLHVSSTKDDRAPTCLWCAAGAVATRPVSFT